MTYEDDAVRTAIDEADYLAELDDHAEFAREVDREAYRLRVRDAARDKVAAERAEPAPPFDADLLSAVLERPQEPPFRVDGLIPHEAGTLIVAQRKTGKTTLMLNLARTLIEGGDFLGRFPTPAAAGRVAILNYEVSAAQLARWADDAQVPRERLLLVNLRGRRNPLPNEEDRARLGALLDAHGVRSLIVDPFGRAYSGKSQNDPGEVGAWLGELDRFAAEYGIGDVILAAHAGWDGERTRGSSALEDWADSIITIVRDKDDESVRYLRAEGRDVLVEEDQLAYDPVSRSLTMAGAGSRKTAKKTRHIDGLIGFAVDEIKLEQGLSGYKLEQRLKGKGLSFQRGDAQAAANKAAERGLLRREEGIRNSICYFLPSHLPDLPAPSRQEGETTFPTSPIDGEVVSGEVNQEPMPGKVTDLDSIRGPLCAGCNCYPPVTGHGPGCSQGEAS